MKRRKQLLQRSEELLSTHSLRRKTQEDTSAQTGPSLLGLLDASEDGIACQTGSSLGENVSAKTSRDALAFEKPFDEIVTEGERATLSVSRSQDVENWISQLHQDVRYIPEAPPPCQDGRFLSPWNAGQQSVELDCKHVNARKSQENRVLEIHICRQKADSVKGEAQDKERGLSFNKNTVDHWQDARESN
jgi:hypothetical protein